MLGARGAQIRNTKNFYPIASRSTRFQFHNLCVLDPPVAAALVAVARSRTSALVHWPLRAALRSQRVHSPLGQAVLGCGIASNGDPFHGEHEGSRKSSAAKRRLRPKGSGRQTSRTNSLRPSASWIPATAIADCALLLVSSGNPSAARRNGFTPARVSRATRRPQNSKPCMRSLIGAHLFSDSCGAIDWSVSLACREMQPIWM